MSKENSSTVHDVTENIEHALTRTEQYIEDNQKSLLIIVGVIVALILMFFGYKRYLLAPKEKEANSQMYVAERYFERDSFNLALNGDGSYPGFLEIIDEYGMTKSANLACYYAGISYLRLGDYEEAIRLLKKFDSNDKMLGPVSLGAIGDAYVELGELEKAAGYFKKAGTFNKNPFTSPVYLMKLVLVYEKTGKTKDALAICNKIKSQYPNSLEGRNIEKYIARLSVK